jgi:hypothetical protein
MDLKNIPPVCKVPNCTNGAQLLSKHGDTVRYMLTCRNHHTGQIPK